MTHRTIKAYSKATHTISKLMMHGNTYTYDEGHQEVINIITCDSNESIVSRAKSECEKLGLELWKVFVVGSKSTSFNTTATWCDGEIYRDDTRALYFEGYLTEWETKLMGNKFWQLQKAANLSNTKCAELIGVTKRTVERYRSGQLVPPKSVMLVLKCLAENKTVTKASEELEQLKLEEQFNSECG